VYFLNRSKKPRCFWVNTGPGFPFRYFSACEKDSYIGEKNSENLWGMVKAKMKVKLNFDVEDLKAEIQRVWESFPKRPAPSKMDCSLCG
jgi:hypothetical protein